MALPDGRPCAVALGYFDGVHCGHRRVLAAAAQFAKEQRGVCVAYTFRFGARRTKAPDILTLTERRRRLRAAGAQRVVCDSFDAIADLSPAAFVREVLAGRLCADVVFCGQDFRFGAGAAGDVEALRRLCAANGIAVQVLPPLCDAAGPVSATRIRALLAGGDVQQAGVLLGQPYVVDLPVRHGQALGAKLGYPTLNQLYPPWMQQPAAGVYIGAAQVAGRWVPCATGIGDRPTVGGGRVTCESYLCRWQGSAYGLRPRVVLMRRTGPVRRYDTLAGLQACIEQAACDSCAAFDAAPPSAFF